MGTTLLASKLQKKKNPLPLDNVFLEVSDVETAQKLSDRINSEGFHKILDAFAKRYAPVAETLELYTHEQSSRLNVQRTSCSNSLAIWSLFMTKLSEQQSLNLYCKA